MAPKKSPGVSRGFSVFAASRLRAEPHRADQNAAACLPIPRACAAVAAPAGRGRIVAMTGNPATAMMMVIAVTIPLVTVMVVTMASAVMLAAAMMMLATMMLAAAMMVFATTVLVAIVPHVNHG